MKTYNNNNNNNNDVTFNFKILNFDKNSREQSNLIRDVHQNKMEGFILKNVFTKEEVDKFLRFIDLINTTEFLYTKTGIVISDPFATISDLDERIQNYIGK